MDQRLGRLARLTGRVRFGRVLGFPLYVQPWWLVLIPLLVYGYGQVLRVRSDLPAATAYGVGAAFVVCLLVSVLLHELGHALVARFYRLGVRAITIELLGGWTEMERQPPRPSVEAAVSLVGPAVSLVLALGSGAVAYLLPGDSVLRLVVAQLAISNMIVAVFNALPGFPLDGGRALLAVVWAGTGDLDRARVASGHAGRALAATCVAAAVALAGTGRLSMFGALILVVVALSIWRGAGDAVALGRAGRRAGLVEVDRLTRPIFGVPPATPLAEARRMAAVAGRPDAALAVLDGAGEPLAVVPDAAAEAVPVARRGEVAVGELARRIGTRLPAGARGAGVVRALERAPEGEVLVTAGGRVVGVVRAADVAHVLNDGRSDR